MFEKDELDRHKNIKYSTCRNKHEKLLYHKFEDKLHKLELKHMGKGRKVSKLFIKKSEIMCVEASS